MMLGALSTGILADKIGRRAVFLISVAFAGVFGIASAIVNCYEAALITRFLVGYGVGGTPSSLSLYVEYMPTNIRGRSTLILPIFYAVGSMLTVVFAWLIVPNYGWRWFLIACAAPSVILFIFAIFLLPESARYLIVQKRYFEAQSVLKRLANLNNFNESFVNLKIENSNIDQISTSTTTTTSSTTLQNSITFFLSTLPTKQNKDVTIRRLSITVFTLHFLQAITYFGLMLVAVDMGVHLSKASGSCDIPLSSSTYSKILITTSAELPGLFLAIFLLELVQRKQILSVFNICAGGSILLMTFQLISDCSIIATTIVFIARGLTEAANEMLWVYTLEAFPTNIRATTLGFSKGVARFGAMISPYCVAYLFIFNPIISFFVLFSLYILIAIGCLILPFDTRNRKLED
eukprot:TRINITY_DN6121_c3_g1_i2.p1 TRINITY_DN6121_c3_g1~~TRINITY_DN6121_c3_g1_i2.p1  ORF type:complete len:405 (+),score=170.00 TRINITY_DN6121_c3_g1_i2:374-1588(+)